MMKRKLGRSGLDVAPLAFGGNVFGWTVNEATSFELLDAFVAAGFNLVDTANSYSHWVPGNKGGEPATGLKASSPTCAATSRSASFPTSAWRAASSRGSIARKPISARARAGNVCTAC